MRPPLLKFVACLLERVHEALATQLFPAHISVLLSAAPYAVSHWLAEAIFAIYLPLLGRAYFSPLPLPFILWHPHDAAVRGRLTIEFAIDRTAVWLDQWHWLSPTVVDNA